MVSHGEKETWKLGRELGKTLKKGDIVALFGELGAGKTVLTKGICEGIGVTERVKSPSFTIMREYDSHPKVSKVYHIDLYRLTAPFSIHLQEIYEHLNKKEGISIIEWADRIEDFLPKDTIKIKIRITGETERQIIILGKEHG